jgi:nitroimidazol reductase NimA-like FMN-containing flavoprotein (pyridoxamine 5'-phosphate oxidase superfamily)
MDVRPAMEMSAAEVDEFLGRHGVGVLALANDGEAYALPMSYGYDGGDRFVGLQFAHAPWSRKREFVDTTEAACFVVHETDDDLSAQSVVVQGRLEHVSDDELDEAFAALADNAVFTALHEAGVPIEEADLELFWLKPQSLAGRKFDLDASLRD